MSIIMFNAMVKLRNSRVDQGLCIGCGGVQDSEGSNYCLSCDEKYNRLRHDHVLKYHADGKCSTCGKGLDRKGWFCIICAGNLKLRARVKCAERRANHLCVQCGESTNLGSYCQSCRDLRNARSAVKK